MPEYAASPVGCCPPPCLLVGVGVGVGSFPLRPPGEPREGYIPPPGHPLEFA
jgi:hypothetical protein